MNGCHLSATLLIVAAVLVGGCTLPGPVIITPPTPAQMVIGN